MKRENVDRERLSLRNLACFFVLLALSSMETARAQKLVDKKQEITRSSSVNIPGLSTNGLSLNNFSAYSLAMPTGPGVGLAYAPLDHPVSVRFHISYMPVFANYYPDKYHPRFGFQMDIGYRIWLNQLVLENWKVGENMYYFYIGGGLGAADITTVYPGELPSAMYGTLAEEAVLGVQRKVTPKLFLFLEFGEDLNWFPALHGAHWCPDL